LGDQVLELLLGDALLLGLLGVVELLEGGGLLLRDGLLLLL